MPKVTFRYITGVERKIFSSLRLCGSWDEEGRHCESWSERPMEEKTGPDGCPLFSATVDFPAGEQGKSFKWGVKGDTATEKGAWLIPTEVNDAYSTERTRSFQLGESGQEELYYLTHCRRLGAQYRSGGEGDGIQFSVWAPNAEKVEVVFGKRDCGYIDDAGGGICEDLPVLELKHAPGRVWDGVWESGIEPGFSRFDHQPYMFRIWKKGSDKPAYRTDIYSQCQIGCGDNDPLGKEFRGRYQDLSGTVSCSVAVNPVTVMEDFAKADQLEGSFIPEADFWGEDLLPAPERRARKTEELVIYELHVNSLGYGNGASGSFDDAMGFLDYLTELGVNAVELLPMSEYEGSVSWGYGTSHYFALEFAAGGRDKLKHIVRACHRKGLSILMDVCYNHYHHSAERAQWMYDSDLHDENIYYWYEGRSSDYPGDNPPGHGGYVDNMSTGYSPRFYEEMVRKMFASSAVMLMEKFHLDGFRLDQTTSMHVYNVLHADGRPLGHVNAFGAKFLREYTRTLKLINPGVILIAEDHSNWYKVTEHPDVGGLGLDATWYADFFHHLVGCSSRGPDSGRLIYQSGFGDDRPLPIDFFAGAFNSGGNRKVVYHMSHDEAGNSENSHRTMVMAVNHAPLIGTTRSTAEARSRFAFGMALVSPGTPMFFMAEEIAAAKDFRYNDFLKYREDLYGERKGYGALMYDFYADLIRFRLDHSGLRSRNCEILHLHNENRVLAARRWDDAEELLVLASLNNRPFHDGYRIPAPGGGRWREIFNSDSGRYGGSNNGNYGSEIYASGSFQAVLPACGFLIFQRVS